MEISKNVTIDGRVVELYSTMKEMSIYKESSFDDSEITLYFVRQSKNREDKVIGRVTIEADCSQNCGFITELNIEEIN